MILSSLFARCNWCQFGPRSQKRRSNCCCWVFLVCLFFTSAESEMKVKVAQLCLTLCDPMSPWNSPGQNTRVGSLSLLQGIFLMQGLKPGLPYCRRIIYQLNSQGGLLPLLVLSKFSGLLKNLTLRPLIRLLHGCAPPQALYKCEGGL